MQWHSPAKQDKTKWHDWFAWHPIRIPSDRYVDGVKIWGEVVERYISYGRSGSWWTYREKANGKDTEIKD